MSPTDTFYEEESSQRLGEDQKKDNDLWPGLASEGLYGIFGDIVMSIEPHTEADPVAILANLIISFGNVVGRNPYFIVEATPHYLNEFVVEVGETAKARKGQSLSMPRKIFSIIDPGWEERRASGLSSGEGLIFHVRDPIVNDPNDPGIDDKRLLIIEQEFSQPLKVMSRSGNILSVTLRQAWDGDDLRVLTKNSPLKATAPHISIIGQTTVEELLRYLNETEMANGFGNRFIWLLVRRSKEISDPKGVPPEILTHLVKRLARSTQFGSTAGEMRRDRKAEGLWADIYHELSKGQPGLTGAMLARAEAHTMRIACIHALADLSDTVTSDHLKAALAFWDYSEQSVRLIFGIKTGDLLADRIYSLVKDAGGELEKMEIINDIGRNYSKERTDAAIGALMKAGLIWKEQEKQPGRGRPKIILITLK